MDGPPGPKELQGAAAVATSLSYVVGLAGVVVGGLFLRDGDPTLAVVVWVLSFAAGAALMIGSLVVRAIADLQGRMAMLESDMRVLLADSRGRDDEPGAEGAGRWGHQPPW